MNTEKPTLGSGQTASEVETVAVKEVKLQNQVGLYARPATYFIQKANEFKSSIWVEKDERRVNAKSLLGILSLGITGGTTIKIIADGSDQQEAVDSLEELVGSGFSRTDDLRVFNPSDINVMDSDMQSSS